MLFFILLYFFNFKLGIKECPRFDVRSVKGCILTRVQHHTQKRMRSYEDSWLPTPEARCRRADGHRGESLPLPCIRWSFAMPSLWLRSWCVWNGGRTDLERNYNGGEGMMKKIRYEDYLDVEDMNHWRSKHPEWEELNVETLRNGRFRLWYMVWGFPLRSREVTLMQLLCSSYVALIQKQRKKGKNYILKYITKRQWKK